MKARKKPIEVEVMLFTDNTKDIVFNWIMCNKSADFNEYKQPILKIQTLEGIMTAQLGDYIIKGINGEYYPCKPDIFEKTYEIIE